MYDGLVPESRENILLNKNITDIAIDEYGVTTTCDDGTKYRGSVIIGADGVHSLTRFYMRKFALDTNSEMEWYPETPFASTYKCAWASFPRPDGEIGNNFATVDTDKSVMYVSGLVRSWIFLYEKLPCKTNSRISYSRQDINEMTAKFADYPINDKLRVQDVLNDVQTLGMSNLEEGMAEHWSFGGRMVLVADACHKMTPNAGAGFNAGLQDVVTLCNALQKATRSENLTVKQLKEVFNDYSNERRDRIKSPYNRSAILTRVHTQADLTSSIIGWLMRFQFVESLLIRFVLSPEYARAKILDYVSFDDSIQGVLPWLY